jgi:hypothetical protein
MVRMLGKHRNSPITAWIGFLVLSLLVWKLVSDGDFSFIMVRSCGRSFDSLTSRVFLRELPVCCALCVDGHVQSAAAHVSFCVSVCVPARAAPARPSRPCRIV